jgi:pyruvate/2-oxoglutarate dehydrogenase complex dihydrolipoamide dehydrogenase (E3) component
MALKKAPVMQHSSAPETIEPDLCVIGAGSGGLSVAAAAASMGAPVVLIEKSAMGGDCLNYGCVPSKALIAAGHAAQAMRDCARFGIAAVEPQIDMANVRAHIRNTIKAIAPNDEVGRFSAMGVRVIRGHARFIAPDCVEADGFRIKARRFVIATGSRPAAPPIPGLESIAYLTNESIFDLEALPKRLGVIGGGPIGVELAQAFRRLGADVIVLEAGKILAREDEELANPLRNRLVREGVVLREDAHILRIEPRPDGARIVLGSEAEEQALDVSHVLVAAGRKPNVNELGLELARIAHDDKGVHVDKSLRTSNRRVYAIGDVAGGAQFTHAANYHAGLVLRATLFRLPVRLRPDLIPRVTYTEPQIAVAGLSESQAREKHSRICIHRWPFSENDRARAEGRHEGHVKIVATPDGKILGAGIVGAHAGELIAAWQLAITKGLKLSDMASVVLPYPTLSEAAKRAAILHYSRKVSSPVLRSVLKFLRRFG